MSMYRELSQYNSGKLMWLWLAIAFLAFWLGKEMNAVLAGSPSFTGIAYVLFFSGMLAWRYAVHYTYSLTKRHLIVTSRFLCFSHNFNLDLSLVESYSGKYIKTRFNRTGIKRYLYSYSSGDGNPVRIIIYNHNGERRALLIKVGYYFMDELKGLVPEKYSEVII